MQLRNYIYFLALLLSIPKIMAQEPETWNNTAIDTLATSFLDHKENVLHNTESLQKLIAKLDEIKKGTAKKAVFVHIGDSHIQADMQTSVIRKEFQRYFGNAGRGIVFPYQIVRTNAPSDVLFGSNSVWKGNRVAKKDSIPRCGVSGFGMISQQTNPEFTFDFRSINNQKETFNQMKLFLGNSNSPFVLESTSEIPEQIIVETTSDFVIANFKTAATGFKINFRTQDTIPFYGVSLENSANSGIIYHAIGANGAKYSDYNKTPLFWSQLKKIEADCIIISLGTNEAQNQDITAEEFVTQLATTVTQIKSITPNAAILITTPPVSYFRKYKPNLKLALITDTILDYCNANQIAYWDLYAVSKGVKGAAVWKKKKLLAPDLVHYSKEGYTLQGNLLVTSFVKLWNKSASSNSKIEDK